MDGWMEEELVKGCVGDDVFGALTLGCLGCLGGSYLIVEGGGIGVLLRLGREGDGREASGQIWGWVVFLFFYFFWLSLGEM